MDIENLFGLWAVTGLEKLAQVQADEDGLEKLDVIVDAIDWSEAHPENEDVEWWCGSPTGSLEEDYEAAVSILAAVGQL
jgi:hypothetical protein